MIFAQSGVASNNNEKRDDNPTKLVPILCDIDPVMFSLKVPADQKHRQIKKTVRDDFLPYASLELQQYAKGGSRVVSHRVVILFSYAVTHLMLFNGFFFHSFRSRKR